MVGEYSETTYDSSINMTCDTGYEGTAADITCTDEGTWSTQTGCSIVREYEMYLSNFMILLMQPFFYYTKVTHNSCSSLMLEMRHTMRDACFMFVLCINLTSSFCFAV